MKIPCTVGILTYNSEEHLARALQSISDFAEIVVADGGSTDGTVALVKEFGGTIIGQSNPGHPIVDFSRERNLTLSAASQPWFFYLDADEIMSKELAATIRHIASDPTETHGAYRVRYLKTSADGSTCYRTFKEYYQIRLVRTNVGAHFERPVHERIALPRGVTVGQTEAPWYVPLEAEDLAISSFARKAWARTGATAATWTPSGMGDILAAVLLRPMVLVLKSLVKMVAVRLRFGGTAIPIKYEMLRILYAVFLAIRFGQRVFTRTTNTQ